MTSGSLAQLACVLEVTARKPGNVHRYRDFADTSYLDFLLSAQAIARPLDRASEIGIGQSVLDCVIATHKWINNNTNLGMILLLAPLAAVPQSVVSPTVVPQSGWPWRWRAKPRIRIARATRSPAG